MSTTTTRDTATRDRLSVEVRLARLLGTPSLARLVPHLTPETLHQLILHRGLDACGELVTLATPAQLTSLLDLDLWRRAEPGRDDQFDADRFGEWLEVLLDTGYDVAARTVAALDPHLVVAGLCHYLRVFDPGTFEPVAQSDDEPIERHDLMNSETSRDVLECEVGGYLVRARRTDAWDAIVALLVTLSTQHTRYFDAVMQGCRRLSHSRAEIDGLDELFTAPEQHLHDASIARERRRSRLGHVTPADARGFLQAARQRSSAANPIAAAFFRDTEDEERGAPGSAWSHLMPAGSAAAVDDVSSSIDAVIELLAEADATPERPRPLLGEAAQDGRAARLAVLTRLMEFVLRHDEAAYVRRSRELAFLANTLLAGCSVLSRPFTPREAADAAGAICNLGLEYWPACRANPALLDASPTRATETAMPPEGFLRDHDLVKVFETGWSVLTEDVNLFVADQLASTLAALKCIDVDLRTELRMLQRTLVKERLAGTPWLALDAADVLAMLDLTAWTSVRGLLNECPILPAALTAVLDRRTTGVSPTAFEFISTTAQIDDIRRFMRLLPGVLAG
jgi:hypothetical protein